MVQNYFLPFAAGSSANVVSDAQWAADLTSTGTDATGFVQGLASSAQINKALRQTSVWAAVLGQIIVDTLAQNATDTQSVATLEGALLAALKQQMTGRLIAVREFSETAIYTPSTGTTSIIVEMVGGGGSGAGSAATGANQIAAGSGGGSGGYALSNLITSGFSQQTITVGMGGAQASAAAAGNAGSESSFLTLSATGGAGGTFNQAGTSTVIYPVGGATGGVGAGGRVNGAGGAGRYAFYANPASSGAGGASFYGDGGQAVTGSGNGIAAVTPGAGGSGGAQSVPSSAGGTGGAGANGLVTIYEFT